MSEINNKQRLLRLLAYLQKNTDVYHQASMADLCKVMGYENAEAGRKTLSRDLKILMEEGTGVEVSRGSRNTWYYDKWSFEKAEVRLMADAVLSARFISDTRRKELVKKLGTLVSAEDAKKLRQRIYTPVDAKHSNRHLYINIEKLMEAIERSSAVCFQYFDYNEEKKQVLRRDGKYYHVNPYDLVWDNEFYYLLGSSDVHTDVGPYRVDRMCSLSFTADKAAPPPAGYSVEDFMRRNFRMFSGEPTEVILECENEVMRSMIDRFGYDVDTWKISDTAFRAKVVVGDSRMFYGWVFSSGGKVRIISPDAMVETYREMLMKTLDLTK